MIDFLSMFVAILPIILIGLYIYKKDKIKEPIKLLFKLFILGILSCFPSIGAGILLGLLFPEVSDMNVIQLFIYVFVTIALVEEFYKWLFLYKFSYFHDEFTSSYDMIVYSVFVSLGFALFENILYVSGYGLKAALVRFVSAVPGHACNGVLMGMYLGIAKLMEYKGEFNISKIYKCLSLIVPIIVHGIYDFCAYYGSKLFIIIFLLFVIFVDVYCIIKVKHISLNSVSFKDNKNKN